MSGRDKARGQEGVYRRGREPEPTPEFDASGFVRGPASATDDHLATFNGATGKQIQDGGATIVEVIAAAVAAAPGITQLTTDVTAGPGSGSQVATIANDAVTNAKLANMAAHTLKGNKTAGSADPADLTATEATAELNEMVGDTGAGGLKGLVPGPAAGDAAAGAYLKADKTWAVPPGAASGDVVGPASAGDGHLAVFDTTTGKLIKDGGPVPVTGGSWIPLVDGSEPPAFVTDGAGALALVAYP